MVRDGVVVEKGVLVSIEQSAIVGLNPDVFSTTINDFKERIETLPLSVFGLEIRFLSVLECVIDLDYPVA